MWMLCRTIWTCCMSLHWRVPLGRARQTVSTRPCLQTASPAAARASSRPASSAAAAAAKRWTWVGSFTGFGSVESNSAAAAVATIFRIVWSNRTTQIQAETVLVALVSSTQRSSVGCGLLLPTLQVAWSVSWHQIYCATTDEPIEPVIESCIR